MIAKQRIPRDRMTTTKKDDREERDRVKWKC